jgi:hypothetical protein
MAERVMGHLLPAPRNEQDLAQLLREKKADRIDELVKFTARISHGQLAAATSTVIVVSIAA